MSRLGPAQWTLADIAAEAGLTAGALVQRFGSKRELMISLTEKVAESIPAMFASLRATQPSPLAAVRAYAECMAHMGDSPRALAHHLAYLQLDLTDPDLHKHLRAHASATRLALRGLLDEAVLAGELAPDVNTPALARAVEVTLTGSLLSWAFYQDGLVVDWVRHDLDALLDRNRGAIGSRKKRGNSRPRR